MFSQCAFKQYGTDENFDVIINIDKGDFEIWRNREVVEDDAIEDPNLQISRAKPGKLTAILSWGRRPMKSNSLIWSRAILNLRQNLASKIMELEKDSIFGKYKDKIGEIVTGEVYQVWKKEILILDDEGNELILPKGEQIPSDYFRKGDTVRAIVYQVELRNNNPLIILRALRLSF